MSVCTVARGNRGKPRSDKLSASIGPTLSINNAESIPPLRSAPCDTVYNTACSCLNYLYLYILSVHLFFLRFCPSLLFYKDIPPCTLLPERPLVWPSTPATSRRNGLSAPPVLRPRKSKRHTFSAQLALPLQRYVSHFHVS